MVQHAPRVLVRLVQGNFALQKVAGDADAVKRLANALKGEPELSPEATEAVLLALAALTEQYAPQSPLSFAPCAFCAPCGARTRTRLSQKRLDHNSTHLKASIRHSL